MPPATRLNEKLLYKIARKLGKSTKYIREQLSKQASRFGVASEAAQVLWAMKLKINTASVLRKLPPHIQEQVQNSLNSRADTTPRSKVSAVSSRSKHIKPLDPLGAALENLLSDNELKSRCKDLLQKTKHFDRALREATTILENRIRTRCPNHRSLNPESLINTMINPDINKAFVVISNEPNEQAGFHGIFRGIVLAFRHKAHHRLDDKVSRESTIKFCGFVDVLLGIVDDAQVRSGA